MHQNQNLHPWNGLFGGGSGGGGGERGGGVGDVSGGGYPAASAAAAMFAAAAAAAAAASAVPSLHNPAETPRLRRPTPLRLQPQPQQLQHHHQFNAPSTGSFNWGFNTAFSENSYSSSGSNLENIPPRNHEYQPHFHQPLMHSLRQFPSTGQQQQHQPPMKRARISEPPRMQSHLSQRRSVMLPVSSASISASASQSFQQHQPHQPRRRQSLAASHSQVSQALPSSLLSDDAPLDLSIPKKQQVPINLSRLPMLLPPNFSSSSSSSAMRGFSANNPMMALPQLELPPPLPPADADDSSGKGGRQPVTSCHQCHQSFLCLRDLNGHFEKEHLQTLLLEFDNTKSWKSSAVDNKELNVEATMVRLENGDTIGFKCPECDFFAKWPTELQKHIMVHSNARPHVCVVCGCTYKWKWDLGRHFDKSHESGEMPNPYKKNTVRPGASSDQPPCSDSPCGPHLHLLQSDINSESAGWNSGDIRVSSGVTVDAMLQLTPEQIMMPSGEAASSEPEVTGGQRQQQRSLSSPQSASADQLTCPICGAKARWKSELKSHLINHSNFKPFRCKFCSYRSKWKWDVVKHLKRCTGKKTALGSELDNKEIQAFVIYDPPDPELYSNEAEAILYADSVAAHHSSAGGSGDSDRRYSSTSSSNDSAAAPPARLHRHQSPPAASSVPAAESTPIFAAPSEAALAAASKLHMRFLPCSVCRHVSRNSADLADHMRTEHC